ncbi:MAG: SPOR domain-containing protein [Roseovarius sp.]|nr:SPOR domain-containing protein [Roseovarius sp.]
MADFHMSGGHPAPESRRLSLAGLSNMAGAIVSLALIGGISVWGYGVVMRDVSGVPVVRALEGPMREAPEDPGGRSAANQGLSVNRVAAEGTAAPPPDRIIIAPGPLDLMAGDMAVPEQTEARDEAAPPAAASRPLPQPRPQPADVHLAVLREVATDPDPDPAPAPALAPRPAISGGLGQSLRPRARPADADPVAFALAAVTGAAVPTAEVASGGPLPGSRLAQLGAFETPEMARAEWDRLSARLGDLLDGKSRVIQRAETGGRSFWRLRAAGFEDLPDARRFCSALQAEKVECIPVVTR